MKICSMAVYIFWLVSLLEGDEEVGKEKIDLSYGDGVCVLTFAFIGILVDIISLFIPLREN